MHKALIVVCAVLFFSLSLQANIKSIDNYELSKFMKKRIVIVDVREPSAWKDTGIIPNSYKITYTNHENLKSWLRVFSRIIKSKNLSFIVVSQKGRKAYRLSKLLNQKVGYQNVYYLKGGIENWMKEDGRVIKY